MFQKGCNRHVNIVGVLNLSPDSFSDGKIYSQVTLKKRIKYLINSGADIIDVGAESTAPGSRSISLNEELSRLKLFFEIIGDFIGRVEFSLDTMKSEVAYEGIMHGVNIINDVSAGRFDKNMFSLIAKSECKYVMMYSKNSSGRADNINFGKNNDILKSVIYFFEERIDNAIKSGIKKNQLIIDPGMGAFLSPDYMDSVKILRGLKIIKNHFKLPIFIGTSRKGFLGKISKDDGPNDRLGSSIASSYFAIANGVNYVRVHDVKEMRQFLDVSGFLLRDDI